MRQPVLILILALTLAIALAQSSWAHVLMVDNTIRIYYNTLNTTGTIRMKNYYAPYLLERPYLKFLNTSVLYLGNYTILDEGATPEGYRWYEVEAVLGPSDVFVEVRRDFYLCTVPLHVDVSKCYMPDPDELPPEVRCFLRPSRRRAEYGMIWSIESDHPEIVAKAREIAGGERNPYRLVEKFIKWVVENVKYDPWVPEDRGALWTLRNLRGDCSQKSQLIVALLRASGVPARLVQGIPYGDIFVGHRWFEAYIPPYGWLPFDQANVETELDLEHNVHVLEVEPPFKAALNYVDEAEGVNGTRESSPYWDYFSDEYIKCSRGIEALPLGEFHPYFPGMYDEEWLFNAYAELRAKLDVLKAKYNLTEAELRRLEGKVEEALRKLSARGVEEDDILEAASKAAGLIDSLRSELGEARREQEELKGRVAGLNEALSLTQVLAGVLGLGLAVALFNMYTSRSRGEEGEVVEAGPPEPRAPLSGWARLVVLGVGLLLACASFYAAFNLLTTPSRLRELGEALGTPALGVVAALSILAFMGLLSTWLVKQGLKR